MVGTRGASVTSGGFVWPKSRTPLRQSFSFVGDDEDAYNFVGNFLLKENGFETCMFLRFKMTYRGSNETFFH